MIIFMGFSKWHFISNVQYMYTSMQPCMKPTQHYLTNLINVINLFMYSLLFPIFVVLMINTFLKIKQFNVFIKKK